MCAQPYRSAVPVNQRKVRVVAFGFCNRHDRVEPVHSLDKRSNLVCAREGATVLGDLPGRQANSGRLPDLCRVHGS